MSTDSAHTSDNRVNVAERLSAMARRFPEAVAVAEPLDYGPDGKRRYRRFTFRELDDDSNRIAAGLRCMGVTPGVRLALLVRPGIEFVSLVFALIKSGAVTILIDPGMGRRNLIGCLAEAEPEGFIAIPAVQAVRALLRGKFPRSRFHVTVGGHWPWPRLGPRLWGGTTLEQIRRTPADDPPIAATRRDDPVAIIFTTGSTGPPKGVLYTHGTFDTQVEEIRDFYGIEPGEIEVPAFPLFGLFCCAMGVTAVIPDMDPTRPAAVDPAKIVEVVHDWGATHSFASPAVWNRVGRWCEREKTAMPTLRRVFSAGAPVPAEVLARMLACIAPQGDIHTPYGATESLPVASIAGSQVLAETVQQTRQGRGVCVGRRFSKIEWKVVRIVDGPIPTLADAQELPPGEIGEIIVTGPVVTKRYVTRTEINALAKIADGTRVWHRIGDAGYLDSQDRFWFCGRVAHRVQTAAGTMFTICCEAIYNRHPAVARSALVGVGPPGNQEPVMIVEPYPEQFPKAADAQARLVEELLALGRENPLTASIRRILIHPAFPVDIRHNVKIFREKLAVWAAKKT